ncbi:hypothetical protein BC835DRAFT_1450461 [Cytidiella melzeri]|nr:hypothetical protein BC835DRAFT_1450461 [Cytidiella melzeri]
MTVATMVDYAVAVASRRPGRWKVKILSAMSTTTVNFSVTKTGRNDNCGVVDGYLVVGRETGGDYSSNPCRRESEAEGRILHALMCVSMPKRVVYSSLLVLDPKMEGVVVTLPIDTDLVVLTAGENETKRVKRGYWPCIAPAGISLKRYTASRLFQSTSQLPAAVVPCGWSA